jgi:hypothetical protein
VFYASRAAQWILVVVVLLVYMTFYSTSGTSKQYVPKSQRSYISRVTHRLGATLETFVIWVWKVLDNHVYKMKTKRHRRKARYDPNCKRRTRFKRIPLFPFIIAMQGLTTEGKSKYNTPFDTDSVLLRIDNCATVCMSPYKSDFIIPLVPMRKSIKGVGGTVKGVMMGTMKLTIEDDQGVPHDIRIPGSFYVPDCPSRLLSPQHWAQKAKDNHPMRHGTWCATYDDEIVLEWNQR